MSAAEVEAMLDAGLVRCDLCGYWMEPYRAKFSTDGSRWFCGEVAPGQIPCCEEKQPCKDCGKPTPVLDLDIDHLCETHEQRAA